MKIRGTIEETQRTQEGFRPPFSLKKSNNTQPRILVVDLSQEYQGEEKPR
jgi:hypothetical protein